MRTAPWRGRAAVLASLAATVALVVANHRPTEPQPSVPYAPCGTVVVDCPEEDSCVADYHDGAWHIIPADEVVN